MRIACLSFMILCWVVADVWAQNAPVPEYLTKQYFPDSVKIVVTENLKGETVSLGDLFAKYKGRKVVIDVWASWCRDCIVGVPHLKEMMSGTPGNDYVFVMISVDKEEAKWKAAIERFDIPGEHYRIPKGWKTAFANYIGMDWIPRYVVLDETGMVIMPKAISSEALSKHLTE